MTSISSLSDQTNIFAAGTKDGKFGNNPFCSCS
jgi:hypothetical protein